MLTAHQLYTKQKKDFNENYSLPTAAVLMSSVSASFL